MAILCPRRGDTQHRGPRDPLPPHSPRRGGEWLGVDGGGEWLARVITEGKGKWGAGWRRGGGWWEPGGWVGKAWDVLWGLQGMAKGGRAEGYR